MTTSIDSVTADAMTLSAEERAELIDRLADTVVPVPPLHPSWDAEIERRLVELEAVGVESIPAEEVFARARSLIEAAARKL